MFAVSSRAGYVRDCGKMMGAATSTVRGKVGGHVKEIGAMRCTTAVADAAMAEGRVPADLFARDAGIGGHGRILGSEEMAGR